MSANIEKRPERDADCAQALSRVLADTYSLCLKTHSFHWNVTGPKFRSLHEMFEEQYQSLSLWDSLDEMAERMRALGQYAPGTYAKLKALATVKENEQIPSADEMLRELIADNETVVRNIKIAVSAAQSAGDDATQGILSERVAYHDKQLWMMKAMAG